MKRITSVFLSAITWFALAGAAQGYVVTVEDNLITVDGTTYNLVSDKPTANGPDLPDGAGLEWEWDSNNGKWKACICQMVAFRALQAVAQHTGLTDISKANTNIQTGWSCDGPRELYVERLGWEDEVNFAYAEGSTAAPLLTLDDAWYEFTIGGQTYRVESQAGNYVYESDTTHAGYEDGWDFFDYRTAIKTGEATSDQTAYFKSSVRPQIVEKFEGTTQFEVSAVPLPGAIWMLAAGMLGMAGLRRKTQLS